MAVIGAEGRGGGRQEKGVEMIVRSAWRSAGDRLGGVFFFYSQPIALCSSKSHFTRTEKGNRPVGYQPKKEL